MELKLLFKDMLAPLTFIWGTGTVLCWISYLSDGKVQSPPLLFSPVAFVLVICLVFQRRERSGYYLRAGKRFYSKGRYDKARVYLEKASINSSEWEADKFLGDIYFYGQGVEKNWGRAFGYYMKVLSQGTGVYYTRSLGPDYSRNMDKTHAAAVEEALPQVVANMEEIAAGDGTVGAEDLVLLGNRFLQGFLGRRRFREAAEYYKRAEEMGDERGYRFSRLVTLEDERSSAVDAGKAIADLHELFGAGDNTAGADLGEYYARGNSHILADWNKARTYFEPLLKKVDSAYASSTIDTGLMQVASSIAVVYEELGKTGELARVQREMLEKIDDELNW